MAQSFPPPPQGPALPPGPPPPPPRRSTRTLAISVAVALVVLVVGAVAVGWAAYRVVRHHDSTSASPAGPSSAPSSPQHPSPSRSGPMPSYAPDLSPFYRQKLDWRTCVGNDECAWLTVPLDYAHPTGRTLRLAVLRVPAQDGSHRLGQLVVDPGGPGGSAVEYAAGGALSFGPELARHYDIVGMDPRGVGESSPLQCLDTKGLDTFLAADPSPDTPAELRRFSTLNRKFGEACLAHDRGLTEHMGTVEVAKDMDVLRAALGERKLDYQGASYGTLIGATYANLFPHHVGKMVLDGAIDPSLTTAQFTLGQAGGFQTALDAFVDDCVKRSSCALGDSRKTALQRIDQLINQADATPLPTGSGRRLTEALAETGIGFPLYAKSLWPQLREALAQAIDHGDGSDLLALADENNDRGKSGYTDNLINALYDVSCLDRDDYVPLSQVPRYLPEFEKVAPTFAREFAYEMSICQTWPVHTGRHAAPLHAKGAPPIVVIGTTRDPATPYRWAVGLARQLDSGHLITRDGDGHTGFRTGNSCVDDAVDAYWIDGKVPRNGLSC